MKTGLLTFHHVVNDGSVMQAVCLYKLLEEAFEGTVELVDYVPLEMARHHFRRCLNPRNPKEGWRYWRRLSRQRRFLRTQFRISPQRCVTSDVVMARRFVAAQNYDQVIVGSDTVWDFSPPTNLPSPPNLYFHPGSLKDRTRYVAFAASCDPLDDVSSLTSKRQELRAMLDCFSVRGVRDQVTMEALRLLGYRDDEFSFVPDPTITWGFTRLLQETGTSTHGKQAAVAVSSETLATGLGAQLLTLGYRVDNLLAGSKSPQVTKLMAGDVLERVANYGRYHVLFTDRFHGSIFALSQGVSRVFFIEDARKWTDANSKGRDLFSRLGLDRHVHKHGRETLALDFVARCLREPFSTPFEIREAFLRLQTAGQTWVKEHLLAGVESSV